MLTYILYTYIYVYAIHNIYHVNILFYMFIYIILCLCCFLSFIYQLCWVFTACTGFSLAAASRGHSLLRCLHCCGFSVRSMGSGAERLQQLWHTGFVAPQHMGSSWPRARTHVPSLAGKFSTTGPPGKPLCYYMNHSSALIHLESGRHDSSLHRECSAPGSRVSCPPRPSFRLWHPQGKGWGWIMREIPFNATVLSVQGLASRPSYS